MKKFFVIGNPIDHSLSPKLHTYWIEKGNIKAMYEKKKLSDNELKNFIQKIKDKEIQGINITTPFKKSVIPYLDGLTVSAKKTQSVNTVYFENDKIMGHNTDIEGFTNSIKHSNFNVSNKKIFILGAGGVVSSIILALKNMNASRISVSNRSLSKVDDLKVLFEDIDVVDWGNLDDFDMIINATSLGLNKTDEIKLDFSKNIKNKFFYDLIYNPKMTNFLKLGKELGNKIENGKMMFIYQAAAAFEIWHGIRPKVDDDVIRFLD